MNVHTHYVMAQINGEDVIIVSRDTFDEAKAALIAEAPRHAGLSLSIWSSDGKCLAIWNSGTGAIMSGTTITKAAASIEPDIVTEGAIHLGYISAIADLVRTLVHVSGDEGLEQLEPVTLETAMYCIAHHVGAVDEIILKLGQEADAGLRAKGQAL